eukprot:CAMPEP_0195009690 /NCGR_PEP_ID=MMETSP0326_2-20130528/9511_1 /TAXON_ID=2866 ORGANISM="Crypthecodinium cohnii, Strain Seligo" /NCGR_SAMPLE_ID=MMETSP0326_2 /ASSEMBLY_ACC=CAM_ASM_000348 /LENGTH=109 /DNA_ID=CAMNT_0040018039 /DNA_START=171 /DNA_END=498 /DNA_ORIENTATION=+
MASRRNDARKAWSALLQNGHEVGVQERTRPRWIALRRQGDEKNHSFLNMRKIIAAELMIVAQAEIERGPRSTPGASSSRTPCKVRRKRCDRGLLEVSKETQEEKVRPRA